MIPSITQKPLFVLDMDSDKSTQWEDGVAVFARDTKTYYIKDAGQYEPIIGSFRGILGTAPSNPIEGWSYIDLSDNKYYIFYGGAWQVLITLTPPTDSFFLLENGFSLLEENGDFLIDE